MPWEIADNGNLKSPAALPAQEGNAMGDIVFEGTRNIFANYGQAENNFTNGLFSLLELSQCEDSSLPRRFFTDLLNVDFPQGIPSFKVLGQMEPRCTVDAQVIGENVSLFFETKIQSYTLESRQIEQHLKAVRQCRSKVKKLVVLTPDDGCSDFIKERTALSPQFIIHLSWAAVRDYLIRESARWKGRVLEGLIKEYVAVINGTIEEQDFIGIIQKVAFNKKTGLSCREHCLTLLMDRDAEWGLPKQRNELDGEHRKLLLYSAEGFEEGLKGVFCEAEVAGCEWDDSETDYPWRYRIKPESVNKFTPPIPVTRIEKLPRFEKFRARGVRTPYWNLLRSEYQYLTASVL